jgi:hypothetical protein
VSPKTRFSSDVRCPAPGTAPEHLRGVALRPRAPLRSTGLVRLRLRARARVRVRVRVRVRLKLRLRLSSGLAQA